jgi:hypothetical protein
MFFFILFLQDNELWLQAASALTTVFKKLNGVAPFTAIDSSRPSSLTALLLEAINLEHKQSEAPIQSTR